MFVETYTDKSFAVISQMVMMTKLINGLFYPDEYSYR
ncbi:hypothetical protein GAB14E_2779 [Colwellia psychrerythraea]|uniref:Uncharacterized protein n=1 Tax=Colwellia psychrerythraea TaxID=28229 RepID=A0A099KT64_COLPS|nr:hypothetical protein GAB14E_2779 [Colwellia psychrerythraea]